MIGPNLKAAEDLFADIVSLNPCGAVDADLASLCADITQTIATAQFPGALVPVIDASGAMQINVATPTVSAWRRLKPILLAFAGPTLTAFDGVPEPFVAGDMAGALIMQADPAVTAIMRLPSESGARKAALRAVIRARDTMARAPELQRSAPVPTSWLLARFQDYLNVGRRDAAAGLLERLRSELRLDALNVKFLEVQLLAVFEDWAALTALPEFPSLCLARRTPAVTAFLLETLYRTHLDQPFAAEDLDELLRRFRADVRPFAQLMIDIPAPPSLGIGGWRIYALEALNSPNRDDLVAILFDQRYDLGWLADLLPEPVAVEEDETDTSTPLDTARKALIRTDSVDSNDLLAAAMSVLARLSVEELILLRETMPFRQIVSATDELENVAPPTSWIAWLERVSDPDFTNALDVARCGKDEWKVIGSSGDPVEVRAFVAALDRVQDNDLASQRTTLALPYLVAWLKCDPEFPRAALSPIYACLLTLFALASARGATTYESSQILIRALLTNGLDQKEYRDLIADIDEIAGKGFGVDMIYWVLEVIEEFMAASSPDAASRDAFLHNILARVAPIYTRLSSLQRSAVSFLSVQLGWTLQSIGIPVDAQADDSLSAHLDGLRIGIYSLTESSSRQAKAVLEQLSRSVKVDVCADHGGNARLRAMAENVDLFVMTWQSAKHAATDFIREHRGGRPLIYAQGKGFSSIVRAIEDYVR